MHCPWFLKPNWANPPFLHWSLEVGRGRASNTTARPFVNVDVKPALWNGERSVGARPVGMVLIVSRPFPPLSTNSTVTTPKFVVCAFMTASVGDPSVPAPESAPVTLKHVTGPETLTPPNIVNDTVPLGFWPAVPLCALI